MSYPILTFSGQNRFLSNFYPCAISYEGTEYPSTEHAYQAAKTLEPWLRSRIADALTPSIAKSMGRQIALRGDWEVVRNEVMYQVCLLKFSDPKLKSKLLATGDRYLEEGNTWGDHYWGVCRGRGENHLGRTLMLIRDGFVSGL